MAKEEKITKEEFNNELEKSIVEEQKHWQKEVKSIIRLIRSREPEDMMEGNALGLSYRMEILEQNQTYLSMLAKEEKIHKRLRAQRTCIYITGRTLEGKQLSAKEVRNPLIAHQKISNFQRDQVIAGELADFEHTMQILRNAIEYNLEAMKTIDSYMYMVKNRLDLFNLFK